MTKKSTNAAEDAPMITHEQLSTLRRRLRSHDRSPLLPSGTVSECGVCGGSMRTTNNLQKAVATPGVVYVVTRLPGAQCERCGAVEYDAGALAAVQEQLPREIQADYETSVTVAGGKTLGTYFKRDLARVLALSGQEALFWKVLDRDRAVVEVRRRTRGRPRLPA